jgi:hypothetical protein
MTEPRRRLLWPAAITAADQRRHHLARLRGRLHRQRRSIAPDKLTSFRTHHSAQRTGGIMPRIIEIVIAPDGATKVQTKGYQGSDCLQASKFLEEALGVIAAEQKTSEFYQATASQESGVHH